VRAVGVIGLPDERRGEAITAVLELKAEPSPTLEDELTALVKTELAPYEVPRAFRYVTELPRTTNGKLQRAELRRRFTGGEADSRS
jgi:acyl-coenzyme A synthetase/AMP-(fatty) acid ligase